MLGNSTERYKRICWVLQNLDKYCNLAGWYLPMRQYQAYKNDANDKSVHINGGMVVYNVLRHLMDMLFHCVSGFACLCTHPHTDH